MISALNADTGDYKCSTINGKVGFIHYQQHCNIKMWRVTTSCQNVLIKNPYTTIKFLIVKIIIQYIVCFIFLLPHIVRI